MKYRLGLGHVGVTCKDGDMLVTSGLASCVGVIMHDRTHNAWGLAHVVMPKAPRRSARRPEPGFYAAEAVDALFEGLTRFGAASHRIRVALVGGASGMGGIERFEIGRRNVEAVRQALWRHRLAPVVEDVGGAFSRTVRIHLGGADAKVEISNPDRGRWTLGHGL